LNDGKVGFAHVNYVKVQDLSPSSQDTSTICGIVITSKDPLNIRKNSSQNAKVISKVARGSALHILNVQGAWYKVKLNDGKVGYGNVDYIKELTPRSQESCGIVTIKQGSLNIRKGPNKDAAVIAKTAKNSALRITDSNGMWYKILLNNGKVGYAHSDYVR
ncbi:SH3 domain-containing protein, partial [Thiotrichales bacterium HSG1]|nr:SH3 domain-containing protein [Thiotrichales bacterium HSG1]